MKERTFRGASTPPAFLAAFSPTLRCRIECGWPAALPLGAAAAERAGRRLVGPPATQGAGSFSHFTSAAGKGAALAADDQAANGRPRAASTRGVRGTCCRWRQRGRPLRHGGGRGGRPPAGPKTGTQPRALRAARAGAARRAQCAQRGATGQPQGGGQVRLQPASQPGARRANKKKQNVCLNISGVVKKAQRVLTCLTYDGSLHASFDVEPRPRLPQHASLLRPRERDRR